MQRERWQKPILRRLQVCLIPYHQIFFIEIVYGAEFGLVQKTLRSNMAFLVIILVYSFTWL